jgi:hypothetical protein
MDLRRNDYIPFVASALAGLLVCLAISLATGRKEAQPTLFMTASAVTVHSPLRQAWPWFSNGQSGGLAARSVDILFQVCLPPSRLHAPVSRGDFAVSQRTVMNNVG